jgi:hypothetical protein
MVSGVAINAVEDSQPLEFFDTVPMLAGTGTRPDRAPPLSAGNGTMDETVQLDASTAGIIRLQENGCMSVNSASVLAKKDMGVLDAVIVKEDNNYVGDVIRRFGFQTRLICLLYKL